MADYEEQYEYETAAAEEQQEYPVEYQQDAGVPAEEPVIQQEETAYESYVPPAATYAPPSSSNDPLPSFDISVVDATLTGRDVEFRVSTQTDASTFTRGAISCERNFSSVVVLRGLLEYDFPSSIIPALATTRIVSSTDVGFVQNDVQRFLRKVMTHPLISASPLMRTFLEGGDLGAADKKRKGLRKLGGHAAEQDEFFTAQKERVVAVEGSLRGTTKASEAVFNERKRTHGGKIWSLAAKAKEVGAKCTAMGESEKHHVLSVIFKDLGTSYEGSSLALAAHAASEGAFLDDSFSYQSNVCRSIRTALDYRTGLADTYENAMKLTKRRRDDLEKAKSLPADKAPDRIAKAEAELEEAEKAENESRDAFNSGTETLRADFDHAEKEHVTDVKTMLEGLVNGYIDFEQGHVAILEALAKTISPPF